MLAALVVMLLAGSAVLGGAAALLAPIGRALATETVEYELPRPELEALALRSSVYDVHGNRLAILHSGQNRAPVALDEVAPALVDAVLAAEDREFYEHDGVDWKGIGRALVRNLDAGGIEQGGSTITQQLVKNTMFEDPQRDLDRKIKEAVLAVGLEEHYSKQEILEQYLNTIYLGNGAYGVRAASERYFGKQPAEVTLPEAALLAGLIANPEGRDPIEEPESALRARNSVLASMVEAGYATDAESAEARKHPLPAELQSIAESPVVDPFVEEVKRQLLRDERLGETEQERYRRLFEGGLRIHTTFDPRLQAVAELAVRNVMPSDVPYTASLVAIDNATGAVRAMVPGTSFQHAGFNLATQGARQTGSSFKPVTFAAALAAGYSPEDHVDASGECEFPLPNDVEPWRVRNYDGRSAGTLTLRDAMAKSSNCAFARLALSVGAQPIVDMAHRLGIGRELQPVPSITLGTQPVSPLEMTAAFSTFATEGVRRPPRFIERVELPDGTVLFAAEPRDERVLPVDVARTVTDVLTGVVERGTGTGARLDRPAAGKTGTNQAYRDAWFVGYTPQLTASVWIGNPDAQIPIELEGRRVTGGSFPARIWRDFMTAAHHDLPEMDFTPPDRSLWPDPGYVSEDGREQRRRSVPTTTTTTVAPAEPTTPPTTGRSTPRVTTPRVTVPPATVPESDPAPPQPDPSPTTAAPPAEEPPPGDPNPPGDG